MSKATELTIEVKANMTVDRETAESVEKIRTLDELQKEAESLPDFEIIETQGKKGNK